MKIPPNIQHVTLVILGSFNPSIFTPAWFGWNKLLPDSTANNADLKVAHPQVTAFETDWLRLEVRPDKFLLNAIQPPFIRLSDLAVRIFRDKLSHTPLKALGINHEVHYCVKSFNERMKLGRQLAPVDVWGEWGKQIQLKEDAGGMTSLTMTQLNPEGRPPGGQINIVVEPSHLVGDGQLGVYVRVNDHYTIKNENSLTATSEITDLLEMNFDASQQHSTKIIDHIMSISKE